jgi:hypothetical protein
MYIKPFNPLFSPQVKNKPHDGAAFWAFIFPEAEA